MNWLEAICAFGVLSAIIPVLAGLYQYILVGLSLFSTHLERVKPHLPRTAILIPAWNEDSVIEVTIDRLMKLRYPRERLRVYVIDDASTDMTPQKTIQKMKQYPGRVFHIRRVAGGEGKAHTLNYGLDVLWMSEWTEAVLIMDADVIYTKDSLAKMSRHLSDPEIGAVTAYIKEGSRAPNAIQRFIGFEYITATGASRRAQNALGFLACLSGGAQLHSRENLMDIGGQIFSHTLAEDTFTTFRTQLKGRKAIFEPNAIVYAEEPDDLNGLWKQRVRWARGNVQITSVFSKLWFNRTTHGAMGTFSMGVLWFSIFLMPIFQIMSAAGLIGLYFMNAPLAWFLFRGLWIIAGVTYLIVTFVSYVVDTESASKTWLEGILFPGLISLSVIIYALVPPLGDWVADVLHLKACPQAVALGQLFLYAWQALSMLVAWLAKEVEVRTISAGIPRLGRWLSLVMIYISGYGPFLCAVTFGAYIKEFRGAEMKWDKTVKTGKVG